MLVAKKEENNYYNANITRKNKNVKREKRNNAKNKLKLFTSAIIVLVLCLLILLKYAEITSMRLEITRLENETIELNKEKQDLTAELDRIKSSSKIEEDARIKLGMDYPTEDQIVFVSIDENEQKGKEVAQEDFLLVKYFKNMMDIVLKLF